VDCLKSARHCRISSWKQRWSCLNWIFTTQPSWCASASRIDFARHSGHYPVVARRTLNVAKWCKLTAMAVCAGVVCNGPIFPQLIAQIAALDHDHGVRLSVTNDEVHLLLTHHHDEPTPEERDSGASLPTVEEGPHVIIIPAGTTMVKQTTSIGISLQQMISAILAEVSVRSSDIFVPQPAIVHSRPPPGAMSTLSAHRSTLLLI
jgi:hypothetical protein